MITYLKLSTLFAGLLITFSIRAEDLRERLKDSHGTQNDLWVYNDIPTAMEAARRKNKPLFVTFRCVPCKDCAAFDADVASGNDRVKTLAKEKFVSVRQVEMKGVDLSLFQFDYDLNWAGMFVNADGTVYARYGTQSAEGSDAFNSIDGLINTMNRVLELHANYPNNKHELSGKRGTKPPSTALELPGLKNPAKYARETTRSNCIHCHNIHDAEHQHAFDTASYTPEMLWKYPLPDNIGLRIDRTSGNQVTEVVVQSPAAVSGIRAGETIIRMNGQSITSIADMQWVLHHLPNTATTVSIDCAESGTHQVAIEAGWKEHDFSWRGSMWNAPPRIQVWLPEVTGQALVQLGLPPTDSALEARWINKEGLGGRQALADGLREKDVVLALAGRPMRMNSREFHAHVKMNYQVGDYLPLTVLRNGERIELKIKLVE